jgi:hypothetical protein
MREQEQYRGLHRCASGAPATEVKTVHGQLYRRAITEQVAHLLAQGPDSEGELRATWRRAAARTEPSNRANENQSPKLKKTGIDRTGGASKIGWVRELRHRRERWVRDSETERRACSRSLRQENDLARRPKTRNTSVRVGSKTWRQDRAGKRRN